MLQSARFQQVSIVVNSNEPPRPVKEDQQLASYIAMVVRNALEDFHCEHLTDDQTKS